MIGWFIMMLILVSIILIGAIIVKKNLHLWLPHYLKRKLLVKKTTQQPVHLMFCFVDHFEPQWGKDISIEQERKRVDDWHINYPKVATKYKDADGVHPIHSFFYPEEEYRFEHLDKIADLCCQGLGEIEVHLHHHNDTEENLTQTLLSFTQTLHNDHGAFTYDDEGKKLQYAFIHGNWCLNNSRPDGTMCGVNNELVILKDTGCFVDMTFPSAPSDTQPALANEIYYATDIIGQPKSHDRGTPVAVNKTESGDLMLITGPLGLNWKHRKKGVFPQIENADVRGSMPATPERVDLWVDSAIHVKGKPEWRFIKIHTHGTQEESQEALLGKSFEDMCQYLQQHYNDGEKFVLHYVSAREMYNIVKAAENNEQGSPNEYRNYLVAKPNYKSSYYSGNKD
ncbi:hypothetical protein [Thalassotalea crassostreae]|uniref:hypothetical protein n=1 Tax=Thalassotalea crassostreae TaxID=1763536 RepID=UPI000ABBA867|nr:hypothetical protein [Thalassotalea crassostreae]